MTKLYYVCLDNGECLEVYINELEEREVMTEKEQLETLMTYDINKYCYSNSNSNWGCSECPIRTEDHICVKETVPLRATKLYNEKYGSKRVNSNEQIKAIEEQMNKLNSDHQKNMVELKAKVEQLSKENDVEAYVLDWFRNSKESLINYVGGRSVSEFIDYYPVENKEARGYIVEKIIEKTIEYYNEGWKFIKDDGVYFIYEYGRTWLNRTNDYYSCKKALIMKDFFKSKKVKEKLTNWQGKNLLKYYFTGEF